MNAKDKKEFIKEFQPLYNSIMVQVYKNWSNRYNTTEIREEAAHWVMTHNHQAIIKALRTRKSRALKTKKLKEKLQEVTYKNELENFLESL